MAVTNIFPPSEQPFDGSRLRQLLLEAVEKCSRQGEGFMQTSAILGMVAKQLSPAQLGQHQHALLIGHLIGHNALTGFCCDEK
jgi:hypothetical protein